MAVPKPSAAADDAAPNGVSRWTVALFALAGMCLGLVLFTLRAPTYEAQAMVRVTNPAGSISDEIAVVTSPAVQEVAQALIGFEPTITVTAAEVASLLTITASNETAEGAAAAANAVADTYVQAQLGAVATIAQPAEAPSDSSGLGLLVYAVIGSLLGAIVGAAVSAAQRIRKTADQPAALSPTNAAASTAPVIPPPASPPPASPPPSAAATPNPPITKPSETRETMDAKPSSFSDAANATAAEPTWLTDPLARVGIGELTELDRRSIHAKNESIRYELVLEHEQKVAHLVAEHERSTLDLRAQVASMNKQLRVQAVHLKHRSGGDQSRAGDLEIQVDALELELAELRKTLEAERIAHTRRITDERGAADRALDNARREYREELAKHVHTHRQTVADYRADLDNELAEDRNRHATALEEQHADYEKQVESERMRAQAQSAAATERHDREAQALRQAHRHELDRQSAQHKETISSLRGAGDTSDAKLRELEKDNRTLRVELSSLEKHARQTTTEHDATTQRLTDELALVKGELDAERHRNTALRADVLRRSAEAHQAIDRAVEERTAQLTELEASVARQRQYADTRVREISAAAEEQARQAATREAGLTSMVSRLKREVEEAKRAD